MTGIARIVRRLGQRSAALLMLALFASCAAEPITAGCSRHDTVSMGPENGFRMVVAAEDAVRLEAPDDRMDVGLTVVPPLVGPVALVQEVEGRTVARYELELIPGASVSTRCRLGTTAALSTCKAVLGSLPLSSAGNWAIEPLGNHVLEAGLAFRTCR